MNTDRFSTEIKTRKGRHHFIVTDKRNNDKYHSPPGGYESKHRAIEMADQAITGIRVNE